MIDKDFLWHTEDLCGTKYKLKASHLLFVPSKKLPQINYKINLKNILQIQFYIQFHVFI